MLFIKSFDPCRLGAALVALFATSSLLCSPASAQEASGVVVAQAEGDAKEGAEAEKKTEKSEDQPKADDEKADDKKADDKKADDKKADDKKAEEQKPSKPLQVELLEKAVTSFKPAGKPDAIAVAAEGILTLVDDLLLDPVVTADIADLDRLSKKVVADKIANRLQEPKGRMWQARVATWPQIVELRQTTDTVSKKKKVNALDALKLVLMVKKLFGPETQRDRSLGLREYSKLSGFLSTKVRPLVESASDVSATVGYETLVKNLDLEVDAERKSKRLPAAWPQTGTTIVNNAKKTVTFLVTEPASAPGTRTITVAPKGQVYLRYADNVVLASYRGTLGHWNEHTPLNPGEYRLIDDTQGELHTYKLEVAPPTPEASAGDDKKTDDKKTDDKKADDKNADDKNADDKKADEAKSEEKKSEEKKSEDKSEANSSSLRNQGLAGLYRLLAEASLAQAGSPSMQISIAFSNFVTPPTGYDAVQAQFMSADDWKTLVQRVDAGYKSTKPSELGQALDAGRTLYTYAFKTTESASGVERGKNKVYYDKFKNAVNAMLTTAKSPTIKGDTLFNEQVEKASTTLQINALSSTDPVPPGGEGDGGVPGTPGLGKLQSQNALLFRAVNHLRRSLTQKYSRWQKSNDHYYAHFRFKYADTDEESYNYAVYNPAQDPSHVYFFAAQPVCVYWARFNIDEGPESPRAWQWLPPSQQAKSVLGTLPTGTFSEATTIPMIPGRKQDSLSDRFLWPTLADLPVSPRTWDVAAQPFDMDAVDQASFDVFAAPAPAAPAAPPELDLPPLVEDIPPPAPPA